MGGLQGQAFLAVLLKAMAAVSALLLQKLIAELYGAQGVGLFALMATSVTFIAILSILGQDYIALRNIAGDLAEGNSSSARAHASASVRITGVCTLIGCLALIGLAIFYARGLRPEMMAILLLALPVVPGTSLGRVFGFAARASGRVLSSQMSEGPITSTMSLILLAIFAVSWSHPPTWTLGLVYGLAYLVSLAFAGWLYSKARSAWKTGTMRPPLRPLVMAGLPLVFANATPYFNDWLIIFTSTAVHSSAVAGQIRIVTLFLSVMYLITIAFDSVFAPEMAKSLRLNEHARFRRSYWQYALGSFALNLPLIAGAVIVPALVLSLFGPEFAVAADALRIGVIIQSLTILMGPAGTVLIMAHRERQIITVNVVGLIVLGLGCAFLIPQGGMWCGGVMGGVLTSAGVLFSRRLTEVILMARGPWRHGIAEQSAPAS